MKKSATILILFVFSLALTACRQKDTCPCPPAVADTTVVKEAIEDETILYDTKNIDNQIVENEFGFVNVSDVAPDVIVELRYYTTYNFVGTRIDGYEEPVALLTREAAEALKRVSDDVKAQGYRLKIFDAYRPARAVRHFVRWAADRGDTLMKPCFYPDIDKARLFKEGYISSRSRHSRGSTVDLTLFDVATGKELDMGTPFDWLGTESHPSYKTGLTEQQYANRMTLRKAMMRHGFRPVATEWWHFTLQNEPYPDTSFDFPVNDDGKKTIAEPL